MPLLNEQTSIINLLHPDYKQNSLYWNKFRLTYEAGPQYVRTYLKKYSGREDHIEFRHRKNMTYCPSFAKMAINEIRNAICQRMPDISREGGSDSYIQACEGVNGGVNMMGSSMNLFMGDTVIPELLTMSKVGVFIDMPPMIGPTIADKGDSRPYIYIYKAEQIRSWTYDVRKPDRLLAILLEDSNFIYDKETGLTTGTDIVYRHLWINEAGKVNVKFYDTSGAVILSDTPQELNLNQIPFVLVNIPDSLLLDAADYQIALLNLESSDLAYILKSNYPFYTEQFDARSESPYIKQSGNSAQEVFENHTSVTQDNVQEVETGSGSGRRYPLGTERPGFIHPSSEPLRVSMEKSDQLKRDIRLLINLAVADLGNNDYKTTNNNALDDGLSLIGMKIESLERRIAELWAIYEGDEPTTINYPTTYSLITDEQRRKEAIELDQLTSKIPSKTYKKESKKLQAEITLGHKIPRLTLEKIKKEIDSSEVVDSDPDIIKTDLENGLVGVDLASKIRGYPPGQVEAAKKDHAERLSRIAISQSEGAAASRGVSDLSTDATGPAKEKQISRDNTQDPIPTSKVRGEGK